ncbi:helix-turn-helix domain-containing protein [Hoyosella rhizosphaerae]|nr:helix-turn-helix domain-containing protein [Hoyosella rhizosphaerae]MBN4927060.1 helix-turn-helix domain-containing protein [Hoyosella rhizosphaerae]
MEADELSDWIGRITSQMLTPASMSAIVERINTTIIDSLPELSSDDEFRRDLDASTRGQVRAFIAAATTEDTAYQPPAEAVALARTVARRGMDVQVLLRVYGSGRTTAISILNEIVQSAPVDPEEKMAALVQLWESAVKWLELSTDVLLSAFTQEREALLRGTSARRAETAHAILAGDSIDTDTASQRLEYSLRRWHTAVVLWSDQDDLRSFTNMEAIAARLTHAIRGSGSLSIPSGARGLWTWISTPAEITRLPELSTQPGVHVALGTCLRGRDGFRQSHNEAIAAQHVANMSRPSIAVTSFADVETAYLLGRDATACRRFIRRTLGGLADNTETAERLRETLRAYLMCGASPARASEELHVHKNTVRYRVEQAFNLINPGRRSDHVAIELALRCLDTFGIDWLLSSTPSD